MTAKQNPRKPAKRGRPTLYRAIFAKQAEAFCLLGADDSRLAEMFEVDVATIHRWKQRHKEFCDAVKGGKDVADAAVAAALFKSATGGHVLTEERAVSDGKGGVTIVSLKKPLAPEVLAQIFWLKNRQPKKWRDRVEVQQDVNMLVFPPKEVLDAIYEKTLAEAAEMELMLVGRRERLGIMNMAGGDDGD